jgi:hypothetical protein
MRRFSTAGIAANPAAWSADTSSVSDATRNPRNAWMYVQNTRSNAVARNAVVATLGTTTVDSIGGLVMLAVMGPPG